MEIEKMYSYRVRQPFLYERETLGKPQQMVDNDELVHTSRYVLRTCWTWCQRHHVKMNVSRLENIVLKECQLYPTRLLQSLNS